MTGGRDTRRQRGYRAVRLWGSVWASPTVPSSGHGEVDSHSCADVKAVGLLMGFGAGTLVSAVGYQLVPEASFEHGVGVGIAFLVGALAYYVADRIVDGRGGADRQNLDVQ